MPRAANLLIDLFAISVLVFVLYFPRYRRPDMVVAYLGMNAGVVSVAVALSLNSSIGTGFGLGLFGALSIIRLRSRELAHQEIAYYFAALALGLLGGVEIDPAWVAVALPAVILAVMFVADHPALFGRYHFQSVRLDRAMADGPELRAELERRLGGRVTRVEVRRVDYVDDSTSVDVRYQSPPRA